MYIYVFPLTLTLIFYWGDQKKSGLGPHVPIPWDVVDLSVIDSPTKKH